ncbi:uncharacterized protein LOC111614808 [Centruroides sculpturatus]|uniref:uncharacterized protein LOC111614808 n=1 Tax=Centruroides sculpturatus TaxID=218467 RepID=UPI000C6DE8D7|nr:uncharacterized protein LOC111614808 [Centruroides sculpturatus]
MFSRRQFINRHVSQLLHHFHDFNNEVHLCTSKYIRNVQISSLDYVSDDNFVDFGSNQKSENKNIQCGAKELDQTFRRLLGIRRKCYLFRHFKVGRYLRSELFDTT